MTATLGRHPRHVALGAYAAGLLLVSAPVIAVVAVAALGGVALAGRRKVLTVALAALLDGPRARPAPARRPSGNGARSVNRDPSRRGPRGHPHRAGADGQRRRSYGPRGAARRTRPAAVGGPGHGRRPRAAGRGPRRPATSCVCRACCCPRTDTPGCCAPMRCCGRPRSPRPDGGAAGSPGRSTGSASAPGPSSVVSCARKLPASCAAWCWATTARCPSRFEMRCGRQGCRT